MLLVYEDQSNLRQLAARADQFQSYQRRQTHELVAVAEEESVAAAINRKSGKKKPPLPPNRKKDGPPKSHKVVTPSDAAAQAAGVCFYHWNWGEKARDCRPPCKWEGAEN